MNTLIKVFLNVGSGVQRVLDVRDQRDSWMPTRQILFMSLQLHLHLHLLDARGRSYLRFKHLPFFNIYLHFFQKTPPLDAPSWMTGAVAPPHSPLHVTEQAILCSYETLRQ